MPPPTRAAGTLSAPIWRKRDLLFGALMLMGGFVVTAGAAFFIERSRRADERDPIVAVVLATITLLLEVWIGALVLLLARWRGASLRDLGFRRPESWWTTTAALLATYGILIAY